MEDDDDAVLAGVRGLAPDADDEQEGGEGDTFTLEMDGQTHVLPAALKGAFLRQADYTRKTQELAAHRRALEAERAEALRAAETHHGASADRVRLAALAHQLETFQAVDWDAYAQQAPDQAQAAWGAFQRIAAAHDQLAGALAHHEAREELKSARETAEAMAETGRKLAEEIEGWSPEIARKLVDYAQAFGVTLEELGEMADPRLWKLLHKAWTADQGAQEARTAEAGQVRPAVVVAGAGIGGGGGVRDELNTQEWIRRRNAQVAQGR